MHLQANVSLAEAPAPGFDAGQLQRLSRSIEAKKHKLEADIDAYIRQKQYELDQYEQDLLAQYREMECGQIQTSANAAASAPLPSAPFVQTPAQSPSPVVPERKEEKEKRTKHTRVHKRERELFGLTTIFLPLLEASEVAPPPTKKENRQNPPDGMDQRTSDVLSITSEQGEGSVAHSADQCKERKPRSSKKGGEKNQEKKVEHAEISYGDAARDKRRAESVKKAKRPVMKKSNLKNSGEKTRRKRVSLVIDDQIVLPADQIDEPISMSPSDANASLSSSTTSLDEAIDPRLIQEHPREYGPVHHSLTNTTSNPAKPSMPLPTKQEPTDPTPDIPSPPLSQSPQQMAAPISQPIPQPHVQYEPPKVSGPTYVKPSSPSASRHIPKHASSTPIYASTASLHATTEEDFSSYVGGISGSGVDDFDQTGSLGFPSSLGASYMESYMQSRPLSVRMAAAGKVGLDDEEVEKQAQSRRRAAEDDNMDEDEGRSDGIRIPERQKDIDEDMEVIGSMEDF